MNSWLKIPSLILLLMLGGKTLAAPPQVSIQNQNPNGRYLVSTPVPFQVQATASAGVVYEVAVAVTNIANNSSATNFSRLASTASTNLNLYFRPPSVGTFQITARARAGVTDTSLETNWAVTSITVTNVGRGERRLNQAAYKSSHNSYARSEPLDEQVDDYNVWGVELDIHWKESDNSFWVEHFCGSSEIQRPLFDHLHELDQSVTAQHKITCVFLQLGEANAPCYTSWPSGHPWLDYLKTQVYGELGANYIYHASEYINVDSQTLPSWQELVRRGYKWYVVVGRGGGSGDVWSDDLFFAETTSSDLSNSQGFYSNIIMANLNAGDDAGGRETVPVGAADHYLFRAYPDAQTCANVNGSYWTDAIAHGYHHIATNCIDDQNNTTDTDSHAPEPTYVVQTSTESRRWGTHRFPYTTVSDAVNRASPMTSIRITPSTTAYSVGAGYVIQKAVILRKDTGTGTAVITP